MPKELNTEHSALTTVHLSPELTFLIACCQAEPTEDLALNADTPVVKTKVGCDTDLIRSYLSQSDTPQPARHPREGGDPQSQSETGTPSSSTPIGDPQSQSDKYQNLILLANRHGVLPLVYKTLKRLSEEGLLRDPRPVPLSSSSTPIGNPQSQSNKHQNLITAASQHGILPLVYKTIKQIVSRHSGPAPQGHFLNGHPESTESQSDSLSSSTPIGDPQSQSDNAHAQLTNYESRMPRQEMPLGCTNYDPLLSALKQQYMGIAQKNMLMTAELLRIMKLLEANNIEALAFKGPALAQMAYGDITMRQFGDLDVLIKKEDIYRVDRLLHSEGYERLLALTPVQEKIWIRYAHDLGLIHREKGTHFEMHWSLMDEDYPMQLDLDSYREEKQMVEINGREIPTFSTENLLVYLCIHGSKHLWERIEWIKDIDLLIRNYEIDWEKVRVISKDTGFERMIYLGFSLSSELFSTPLPTDIHAQIQRTPQIDTVSRFVLESWNVPKSTFAKTSATLKLFPGMKERAIFLHKIILKPSFNEYWFIDLPKGIYWAYYLIRPYLLLKKYLSKKDQRS